MLRLTDNPALDFLNADQTMAARLETQEEERKRKVVTYAGTYGAVLLKTALIAPVIGSMAAALPVTLAVVGGGLFFARHHFDKAAGEQPSGTDLADPTARQAFIAAHKNHQPDFVDDYIDMCRMAGLTDIPRVIISDDSPTDTATFKRNGKNVLFIGRAVFENLTPAEMRAVTAHEICHMALNHNNERINGIGYKLGARILTGAAIAASLLTPAAIVPVIAGLWLADKANDTVHAFFQRRKEATCDRAAAILCGGGADLASALSHLDSIHAAQAKPASRAPKPVVSKIVDRFLQPKLLHGIHEIKKSSLYKNQRRFTQSPYPRQSTRIALLTKFEAAHPQFCESRRACFRRSFNEAAPKNTRSNLPEYPDNRMKYQLKKIS